VGQFKRTHYPSSRAIDYHEQSLVLKRAIDDRPGEAMTLCNLGTVYGRIGEHHSIQYYERALMVQGVMTGMEGVVLGNLGNAYRSLGDIDRAIQYYERARVILQEIGNRSSEGIALWNMGLMLNQLGDRERAIDSARAALKIFEEIENPNADKVRKQLEQWRNS
jgi:tetratricopeptide (TPR) repeat protein